MQFSIRPNLDYVVVKITKESVRPSGIVIPDTVALGLRGHVIAVGEGRRSEYTGEVFSPYPKVGDEVFIARASGQELILDKESYVIVKSSDVLCILDPIPEESDA